MFIRFFKLFVICILLLVGCATFGTKIDNEKYLNSARDNLELAPELTIESCSTIIRLDKTNPDAYYLRAMAYSKIGQQKKAESDFLLSLRLNQNNESAMTGYANLLCSIEDYTKAQTYYDQAYNHAKQTGHNLTMIYVYNGDCLTSQNKLDPAINSYTSALADESAPVTAYIGIAHAYLLQENYPIANYYLNLYKGPQTREYLQLELITLNRLLNSNIKLADKNKLEQMQALIKQQLKITEPGQPIAKPAETTISIKKTNSAKTINPLEATSSTGKENLAFGNLTPRVETTTNGKNYIIIKAGDTLFRISRDSNLSVEQLKEINHFKNNEVILGSKLFLN